MFSSQKHIGITLLVSGFIVLAGGAIVWQYWPGDKSSQNPPRSQPSDSNESSSDTQSAPNDSSENTFPNSPSSMDSELQDRQQPTPTSSESEQKHSIPLEESKDGGPGKDGIPSIDNPKFTSTAEADQFLGDDAEGLGISLNGQTRFYPYTILVRHEIVNDTFQGTPLAVTYCPLCKTGIVFERTLDGQPVEFGVSGKLYKTNLLMYNRGPSEEESYWSQVKGEAVVGPRTGEALEIVNSTPVKYGRWKSQHPDTQVLSRDTGFEFSYGASPYGNYDETERIPFGTEVNDDRLSVKQLTYGIKVDGQAKAYPADVIGPDESLTDTVSGVQIRLEKDESGSLTVTRTDTGKKVNFITGFWFSWVSVNPATEVYQGN